MAARDDTSTRLPQPEHPEAFRRAAASLTEATLRPEVSCESMPAPQRIAPWATALQADVTLGDEEVGTGRLILLHDPAGNDAWGGTTFRFISYARAEVELEMVNDPLFAEVAWSWLIEALGAHGARWTAESGTVTRVATENFGEMGDELPSAQVEIRSSWSPEEDDADFAAHVSAWGELLCTISGLEPIPEGVIPLPTRRGQRGLV